MQEILEICCGLDVHKESVVACLLKRKNTVIPENKEIRTFNTFLNDLEELKKWLESENCHHVAMESTGVYWFPVYDVLETAFDGNIELLVTNARHMKNVPGKKTDVKDAEWIATLLRAGLLRGSFIPPSDIRELRQLTRYRKNIVGDMNTQKNRIEKFLQQSGFKLSTFLSDVFGVSGRNLMRVLVSKGKLTPLDVENEVRNISKGKKDEIKLSINGVLNSHQKDFLKMQLTFLDELLKHLQTIEDTIAVKSKPFEKQIENLDTIPGVAVTAATAIIAEIGIDMSKFPTAEHFCSWAGVVPGNNESAGKKKTSRITLGNNYIKGLICECAWSVVRSRNTFLSNFYWKLKQKRGTKKAIIALSRKILVIIYNLLKNDTVFSEQHFETAKIRQEAFRVKKLNADAKKLGFELVPLTTA